MADTLTKLAYQALQQGKSLVGVAHKEVSTKLMELVAPEGAPKTRPIPPQLLGDLQASNAALMGLGTTSDDAQTVISKPRGSLNLWPFSCTSL